MGTDRDDCVDVGSRQELRITRGFNRVLWDGTRLSEDGSGELNFTLYETYEELMRDGLWGSGWRISRCWETM